MNLKKQFLIGTILLSSLFNFSCDSEAPNENRSMAPQLTIWPVPAPGTEVAHYSKEIAEDKLNDAHFEVKIFSTDESAQKGNFEIRLSSGPGTETSIEKGFPKWTANNVVKPTIKPVDTLKYGAVIGFDPGDGSFKDLFIVSYKDNNMEMHRLKFYSLAKTPANK